MGSPDLEEDPQPGEAAEGEDLEFEIGFYEAILERVPDSLDVLMALGNNYMRSGRFDKALDMDRRLCRLRADDPILHYNLACIYSLLGRFDESLEALQLAVALGYDNFTYMQRDPDLEGVRGDPRYLLLLARAQGQEMRS